MANFMDDESQGFCLVSVPDYQPRSILWIHISPLAVSPLQTEEKLHIRLMFEERTFTVEMDATSTCRQLLNKACHMLYPGRVIHSIHIHI